MKNYRFLLAGLSILSLALGMFSGNPVQVRAQSEDGWSEPVNLSNSGSSVNPIVVVDSLGSTHVFWLDKFSGFMYANSVDGVTWSEPKPVKVPFPSDPKNTIKPVFLSAPDGTIHILWQDDKGILQYIKSSLASLGDPTGWTGHVALAESVVKFDAVLDSQGGVHVGYINNLEKADAPAGIYFRHLDNAGWSAASLIYPSKYYRSLSPTDDTNIQLAASTLGDAVNVYIGWDDRAQKRIFLAKSADGGKNWDGTFEVRGPEDFTGLEMPFNIDLGADEDQVLLTWQAGTPGGQCVLYSQWSTDGAKQFGQPVKMLDSFAQCPQSGQFIQSNKDFSVVLLNTLGDLSMLAWDGTRWSKQLTQSEIGSFTNTKTLDNVIMGCQDIASVKDKVYMVGCDTGQGGDIWFASRPLGAVQDWFPSLSLWSHPEVLTDPAQKVTSLLSIADQNNSIHDLWVQSAPQGEAGAMIQYARWEGEKWSEPATVLSGSDLNPVQLTVNADNQGKLLLAWVDDTTGDMHFTWANADSASSATEWQAPVYIPSVSSTNSSPDIVVDSSGRMAITFAVPINEERGIYIIESDDFGTTWSQPHRVFDASAVDWHVVDRPHIALTGDGRLHILFERYTLLGDQRHSNGLYYIQSSDGGVTWSEPEQVSDQPILWSDLVSYGKSDLHRVWQEDRGTTKVSIHQYSSDGGTTWSTPYTLSALTEATAFNNISADLFGNLYYLQLTGPEESSVLDQRWDKSGWKVESPKVLNIDPKTWNPASVVSSVSSDGHLVASVLGASPDAKSKWQSEILSMSQFLQTAEVAPTPYPALIAAAPVVVATQAVVEVAGTPASDSPLANIDDSQPFLSKQRLSLIHI